MAVQADEVIARAPATAAGADHAHAHTGNCLNCGATLTGRWCASCGQPAHIHRTVSEIWHELLHGVLHMDGKLWRTLPELARRPGELTRRYIAGERAKFVSPFALFLFSALLMYASYSLFGDSGHAASRVNAAAAAKQLGEEVRDADRDIADLQQDLRDPEISAGRRQTLEGRLAQLRQTRDELARAAAANGAAAAGRPVAGLSAVEKLRADRAFIAYRLKANAYKFSWTLILISTPLMWLLFARNRRYGLYDHAVFVTYSIAFMSLLFSAWTILSGLGLGHGLVMLAFAGVAMAHMFAQLKGAYELSTKGALLRAPVLYVIAILSAAFFYAFLVSTS